MTRFAFEVSDAQTGQPLGGVCYDDGVYADSEPAWRATHAEWARHHPGREIHVEEITPEAHDAALGRS